MTDAADGLRTQLAWLKLDDGLVAEYRFHPTRRWRFDLAWPDLSIAVEVEGGSWVGGRHTRPDGFERDMEKYNEALLMGWSVLRVTPKMIDDGRAVAMFERARRRSLGTVRNSQGGYPWTESRSRYDQSGEP